MMNIKTENILIRMVLFEKLRRVISIATYGEMAHINKPNKDR